MCINICIKMKKKKKAELNNCMVKRILYLAGSSFQVTYL